MIGPGGLNPNLLGQALGSALGAVVGGDPTSTDARAQAHGKGALKPVRVQMRDLVEEWRQEAAVSSREDTTSGDGYAAGLRKAADDLAKLAREGGGE